jgi:hypothetical protein
VPAKHERDDRSRKLLWLTTREMGFALEREENEIKETRDCKEGKRIARRVVTQASVFIKEWSRETDDAETERQGLKEEGQEMQDEWGETSETEQRQQDTVPDGYWA